MHKSTMYYDVSTDDIPQEWIKSLERDHLAKIALKGPGRQVISNILQYSKQLAALGSVTKMLVNLN